MTNADAVARVAKGHRITCWKCGRRAAAVQVIGSGDVFGVRVKCCTRGRVFNVPMTWREIEDAAPKQAWAPGGLVEALIDRHGRHDAGSGVIVAERLGGKP